MAFLKMVGLCVLTVAMSSAEPTGAKQIAQAPLAGMFGNDVIKSIEIEGMPGWRADFYLEGERGVILLTNDASVQRYYIDTTDKALTLLADRQLEGLWAAIEAWAGPGLRGLRDRRLAAARAIAATGSTEIALTTSASGVRPPLRAAMLLADALVDAGQIAEAIQILDAKRIPAPGTTAESNGTKNSGWDEAEWGALTLKIASYQRALHGIDAALAVLDDGEKALGDSPYAQNFRVTRAGYLAEAERFSAALETVRNVEAEFAGSTKKIKKAKADKVLGSNRQFAWIQACALTGLQRTAEAEPYRAALLANDEPFDRDFYVSPNAQLRLRFAQCAMDVSLALRDLAAEAENRPIGGSAFLLAQPGYRNRAINKPAFIARLAADPGLKAVLGNRLRLLPAEYAGALSHWNPAPAPHTPLPLSPLPR